MSVVTREQINKVKEKLHEAQQEVSKYNKALISLREICDHKMKYLGHGHKDSLYRCDVCGYEELK